MLWANNYLAVGVRGFDRPRRRQWKHRTVQPPHEQLQPQAQLSSGSPVSFGNIRHCSTNLSLVVLCSLNVSWSTVFNARFSAYFSGDAAAFSSLIAGTSAWQPAGCSPPGRVMGHHLIASCVVTRGCVVIGPLGPCWL